NELFLVDDVRMFFPVRFMDLAWGLGYLNDHQDEMPPHLEDYGVALFIGYGRKSDAEILFDDTAANPEDATGESSQHVGNLFAGAQWHRLNNRNQHPHDQVD